MMIVNLNEIRSKLSYKKLTQKQAALNLGISREAFNSKINGKSEFSISELFKLSELTGVDMNIFFKS